MKSVLVTGPTAEPVSTQDVVEHSRIQSRQEDRLLDSMVLEARAVAEDTTWRKLITQTWDDSFDRWTDPLRLRQSPVQSITSVTYLDADGATQTLSTSIYELGDEEGLGVVRRQFDQVWPTLRGHVDDITVRYVAGYGDDADDVPYEFKAAIRLMAAHSYVHREGEMPIPQAVWDLLSVHTAKRFI